MANGWSWSPTSSNKYAEPHTASCRSSVMKRTLLKAIAFPSIFMAAACSGADSDRSALPEENGASSPAADARPGEGQAISVEGRIEAGVECSIIRTPDGEVWAWNEPEADFGPGDYVRITGEVAQASICQQGEGTIMVERIDGLAPPARDRDPARAGGVAVTSDYVRGSWVAKGSDANCDRPDFQITANRNGGNIIETSVNGVPTTGYVDVGDTPELQWDQGLPDMPIEARGPDGLAVMPGEGRTVTLAGHRIEGDGVVFVKCA